MTNSACNYTAQGDIRCADDGFQFKSIWKTGDLNQTPCSMLPHVGGENKYEYPILEQPVKKSDPTYMGLKSIQEETLDNKRH